MSVRQSVKRSPAEPIVARVTLGCLFTPSFLTTGLRRGGGLHAESASITPGSLIGMSHEEFPQLFEHSVQTG
jgi:hypothetical protein